jgi:uncharacterized membrane protein
MAMAEAARNAMMRWAVWLGAAVAGLLTAAGCGALAFAVASVRCCGATAGTSWEGRTVLVALVIAISAAASIGGAALGWLLERLWRRSRQAKGRR